MFKLLKRVGNFLLSPWGPTVAWGTLAASEAAALVTAFRSGSELWAFRTVPLLAFIVLAVCHAPRRPSRPV